MKMQQERIARMRGAGVLPSPSKEASGEKRLREEDSVSEIFSICTELGSIQKKWTADVGRLKELWDEDPLKRAFILETLSARGIPQVKASLTGEAGSSSSAPIPALEAPPPKKKKFSQNAKSKQKESREEAKKFIEGVLSVGDADKLLCQLLELQKDIRVKFGEDSSELEALKERERSILEAAKKKDKERLQSFLLSASKEMEK